MIADDRQGIDFHSNNSRGEFRGAEASAVARDKKQIDVSPKSGSIIEDEIPGPRSKKIPPVQYVPFNLRHVTSWPTIRSPTRKRSLRPRACAIYSNRRSFTTVESNWKLQDEMKSMIL